MENIVEYTVVSKDELQDHAFGELSRTQFCDENEIVYYSPWLDEQFIFYREWFVKEMRKVSSTGKVPKWGKKKRVKAMMQKMRACSAALLMDMEPADREYWEAELACVKGGCLLSAERSFFGMHG